MSISQDNGQLVVVCAYMPEARPLIDALKLRAHSQLGSMQVFGQDPAMRVIVSGQGMAASASAVGLGRGLLGPKAQPCFLNLGICGHKTREVGQAFLVHQVQRPSGDRALYPAPVHKPLWRTDRLITQDHPESRFSQDAGYDMEGYGFLSAALRFVSAEQTSLLKVVSDGPSDHQALTPFRVPAKRARQLIRAHVPQLLAHLDQLRAVSQALEQRRQDPPHLEELLSRAHFSQTQAHRLHTLLLRWSARHQGQPPCPPGSWFDSGAQAGLDALSQALARVPEPSDPASTA